MKAVSIDFGPSAQRPRRRAAWALLVLALAVAAAAAHALHPLWQQWHRLRGEHRSALALRGEAERPPPTAQDGATPARDATIALAAERLATPWAALLAGIESASGPQATLLALSPDAAAREVRIQAQARDLPALLAYARRLAGTPGLLAVRLESHQVLGQHAQRPVDGALVAQWPAAPAPPLATAPAEPTP